MIPRYFIFNVLLATIATAAVVEKSCPLYPPPKNGALACITIDGDRSCAAMCQNGFDFVFNPPMLYSCVNGKWNFHSLLGIPFRSQLPWPDCSSEGTTNPSFIRLMGLQPLYSFDANDPNVQNTIKTTFITLAGSPFVPGFCKKKSDCKADKVKVYV